MKTLLCFNIIEEEKKKALRLLSLRLGLDCREVPASLQGCTIADLLTGGAPQTPLFSKPFAEEMLVMSGLSGSELNMLLDGLRQKPQARPALCRAIRPCRARKAAKGGE